MSYPRIVLLLGAFALLIVLAAGPGHRFGLWDYKTAFALMTAGVLAGGATFVLTCVGFFMVRRFPTEFRLLYLAVFLAFAALLPPMIFKKEATKVPPIHDISTDTADPPAFVALLDARLASANGADYGGPDVAAMQQVAYPEIQPHPFAGPPDQAFGKALDAAKALGWEIAAADAAAGRIEATATTAWFGFKDDVIVRVRPAGNAIVIDVRSVSRVGISDVGANAARIRAFFARL
jgi:uncharacterized protein (DUF1499 family)